MFSVFLYKKYSVEKQNMVYIGLYIIFHTIVTGRHFSFIQGSQFCVYTELKIFLKTRRVSFVFVVDHTRFV